jgi:hypothetical protein
MVTFRSLRIQLAVLSLVGLTASCATTYEVEYGFTLEQAAPGDPLRYDDEEFEFVFQPTHDGLAFRIRNLTDENATLEWDKSFFVQPDGNTYRALNTDVLEEADSVALKSANSSIIPAGAGLKRFTTATTNAVQSWSVTVSGASTYSTHLRWHEGTWNWYTEANDSTFTGVASLRSTKNWDAFIRYWPDQLSVTGSTLPALQELADTIKSGPTMSLGLTIAKGTDERTYRFDFTIDSVFVFGMVTLLHGERRPKVQKLHYVARADSRWEWFDARKGTPLVSPPSAEGDQAEM